jgi:hypothetical protein
MASVSSLDLPGVFAWVVRLELLFRGRYVDVDFPLCADTSTEKEVESKDSKQDNNNDGDGSHTATGVSRVLSHTAAPS